MSIVISVTNQKGGVGKTTSAVNLSAALARNRKRTLLVDFDPQGHATEHMGAKVSNANDGSEKSVLEVVLGKKTVPQVAVQSYLPNLSLLTANLRLGLFNQNTPQGMQFRLKQAFTEEVHNQYDFIVIDCQPSLSLLTLNALTSADFVLLPVQAEFLALDGLSQLVVTLKEVQTKLHPKLAVLGILLTMFDNRNRLSTEVLNELKRNFDKELFKTLIPRNVKLAEAPSFGKSIFDYDSGSLGAKAYDDLALEILTKLNLS